VNPVRKLIRLAAVLILCAGLGISVKPVVQGVYTEYETEKAAEQFYSQVEYEAAKPPEAMAYEEAQSTSTGSKSVESAMELERIVQTALSEAQIESLVIAKGYTDCVAYMSGEGISVAVAAPEGGLQQQDVAVIADIVITQSEYDLEDIRIVEVQ